MNANQTASLTWVIAHAATPITVALVDTFLTNAAIGKVQISYSTAGVKVAFGEGLSAPIIRRVFGRLTDAFTEAGWGFTTRYATPESEIPEVVRFQPPWDLTRF